MPLFDITVAELITRRSVYTIDAPDLDTARELAESGETVLGGERPDPLSVSVIERVADPDA